MLLQTQEVVVLGTLDTMRQVVTFQRQADRVMSQLNKLGTVDPIPDFLRGTDARRRRK